MGGTNLKRGKGMRRPLQVPPSSSMSSYVGTHCQPVVKDTKLLAFSWHTGGSRLLFHSANLDDCCSDHQCCPSCGEEGV